MIHLQWMTINKLHDNSMTIEVNWFWNWIAIIIKSLQDTQLVI